MRAILSIYMITIGLLISLSASSAKAQTTVVEDYGVINIPISLMLAIAVFLIIKDGIKENV